MKWLLRYGVSVKLEPLQEEFKFDIDMLLANTKYFFNVVDEFIVCKYRYRVKGVSFKWQDYIPKLIMKTLL